ncbi:trehalase family glycosidase [Gramella sp. AN32]|uniref:Amylo-alpha-1,6-glucosidase n=1 Tax=Christiangramia antarctica TaxID=2058158 RepID=A0ABW5X233_9FLAO|nr:trehalase family glycosidase [Gramella sp. AN32]MCM4156614.1 trehalase-like protein [Gramella sp. AN32]
MTNNEIFEKSRKLLHENMVRKKEGNKVIYHYTKPSPDTYPYQFFWDTCFHVFILCNLDEFGMAKAHIKSLISFQKEDGFLGHMIYWDRLKPGRWVDFFQSKPRFKNLYKSHMSALIQPPIIAMAVERLINKSGDIAFLKEVLPNLKKYYQWLQENRDFDGDHLLTIISPFESGMDWKPTYDQIFNFRGKANAELFVKVVAVDVRNFINNYNLKKIHQKDYFQVKGAGFNSIYAQNLRAMSRLCDMVEDNDANSYDELANKVEKSILQIMYHEEDAAFYDCYGKDNTHLKVKTPTIFYPLSLETIEKSIVKKVIEKHLIKGEDFNTAFPLPSVAISEPSFNPKESIYIWRGPTWIVNNWFLYNVFLNNDYKKEAAKIADNIRTLIEKSGFREYYNPFTGEGYGAQDFTWAGLITDMISKKDT